MTLLVCMYARAHEYIKLITNNNKIKLTTTKKDKTSIAKHYPFSSSVIALFSSSGRVDHMPSSVSQRFARTFMTMWARHKWRCIVHDVLIYGEMLNVSPRERLFKSLPLVPKKKEKKLSKSNHRRPCLLFFWGTPLFMRTFHWLSVRFKQR